MKSTLLPAAAVILLALCGSACAQSYTSIANRLTDIDNKIDWRTKSVIVVGDSLTEEAPWPEQVCGLPIVNAGVGGSRTADMIPLVIGLRAVDHHPAAIVIATGMNDANKALWKDQSYEATFQDTYRAIVQAALDLTPTVLLADVSPVDYTEFPVGNVISKVGHETINKDIHDIGAQMHLTVINNDALGHGGDESFLRDGVHFKWPERHMFSDSIMGAVTAKLCP